MSFDKCLYLWTPTPIKISNISIILESSFMPFCNQLPPYPWSAQGIQTHLSPDNVSGDSDGVRGKADTVLTDTEFSPDSLDADGEPDLT